MSKLNQATHWMATKFSSKVVMISFTCQCARASAGTSIQTAPATAATMAMTSSTTYRGPPQWMPMPAAAQAPMKNCPSEPMFQIFMRSAMWTASALMRIGVRSTPNSSIPCTSRKVPSTAFHSRFTGFRPVSVSTTAATASAATTPLTRASMACAGVTFRRRSTRSRRGPIAGIAVSATVMTPPQGSVCLRVDARPSAARSALGRRGADRTRP